MKNFWISSVAVFVVIAFFIFQPGRTNRIVQPISFNHKLHIGMGLECEECHQTVHTSLEATLPDLETCLACHQEAQSEDPKEDKVRAFQKTGGSIPWVQVHVMPAHVFFTHRLHTTIGGIACATCHGDVSSRTEPFAEPEIRLTMTFCLDCHQERGMNNDCSVCHR